ncbi:hypothetical protein PE066_18450 [Ramlibacter tataouinensis]|uniref:hypothetical protein n=1 Tax=Ramlibacter tataouinensis TaxID=94132 RepID=UPI0022F3EF74|nr:hypothetical protein [Ramlibacter tataouinensis]WBY01423.1 hypothetical protein PE066_18450 [Ramlibacter tataouinensis]
MTSTRSLIGKAALLGGLAFAALGTAQAKDVYWSVGVHAAPGVHVGVGNHRPPAPVVVAPPAPVIVPPVVYTQPQVIYTQPQVAYPGGIYYAQPAPVVVYRNGWAPRSQWDGHRHRKHRGHGHGHGHGHWR